MEAEHWNQILQISHPVLSVLLLANGYLVWRLVKNTEQIPIYGEKIEHLEKTVEILTKDLKDIVELRERIAVLEFALKGSKQ